MSKVTAYNNKPYPLVYLYTSETSENGEPRLNKLNLVIISLFVVLCLLLSGVALYFYKSYQDVSYELSQGFEGRSKIIVSKLSKITIVPKEGIAKVDIVTDIQDFQHLEFSKELKVGDYIVSYQSPSKVYAFRESSNMLIGIDTRSISKSVAGVEDEKVAPKIDSTKSISTATASAKAPAEMLNIKILNGTKTVGVGTDFQRKLQEDAISGIKVSTVESAGKSTYKGSKIVILKANAIEIGDKLTEKYSLEPIELPESEEVSEDIDILIIIGSK